MAAPTRTDLQTMDFHWFGAPETSAEPTSLQTYQMDYHWFGAPVVVTGGGGFVRYYYDLIGQSHA